MLKSWTEFLDVLRLVWNAADSKQSLYAEVTGIAELTKTRTQMRNDHNTPQRPLQLLNQNSSSENLQLSAYELQCKYCPKTFVFTVDNQELHLKNDWQHTPTKCDTCRDKFKNTQPCYDFQKGLCRFGSNCKYAHDDAGSSGGDSSDVWNMAPGSIETNCRDFPDCTRGDKCPFTHAGREREQNEEAIKIEKNNDFVQPQGLSGLKKK